MLTVEPAGAVTVTGTAAGIFVLTSAVLSVFTETVMGL